MNRTGTLFIAFFAVTALAACGGDTGTQPVDPATTVAAVSVTAPRTTLTVGKTMQLTVQASNSVGTILIGKPIKWVSTRTSVAAVSSDGLVTGASAGTTLITATSEGHADSVLLSVRAPNQIVLTSDAGDYIGAGANYNYNDDNAVISVVGISTLISVSVTGQQRWSATFKAPSGVQLAPGTYTNATRWPFQGDGAGLVWDGEGRGCNTLTGFFTVDSITWSGGNPATLVGLDLRFEQHCEGGAPALRGTIHWHSDDPSGILWQPPGGAVPASGDVVYLQSQPGDYIGMGTTNLYQTDITASATGPLITIRAGGYTGNFQEPSSSSDVKVGYYGDLHRYLLTDPLKGSLDWAGNGRGCNALNGWFNVDRVFYAGGVLAGVELRFGQHCEGAAPALNGYVRWGRFS